MRKRPSTIEKTVTGHFDLLESLASNQGGAHPTNALVEAFTYFGFDTSIEDGLLKLQRGMFEQFLKTSAEGQTVTVNPSINISLIQRIQDGWVYNNG